MSTSRPHHLPAPGDDLFVYTGPGLITRLIGWAHSSVELLFGDSPTRPVAVYRDHEDRLDITASAVALSTAEASWHLVGPQGHIVGGGPRTYLPSLNREELEAIRDSGQHDFQAGATAHHGIPPTALRSPSLTSPREQAPADGGFTTASGGFYRWTTH